MKQNEPTNKRLIDDPLFCESLDLFAEWDATGKMPEKIRVEIEQSGLLPD